LRGCAVARLRGCAVARLRGCAVARLRGCAVARESRHVLNSLMVCAFDLNGSARESQALMAKKIGVMPFTNNAGGARHSVRAGPPHEPRSSRRKEARIAYIRNRMSLLTSAATVQGFKARNLVSGKSCGRPPSHERRAEDCPPYQSSAKANYSNYRINPCGSEK
jgi:hypothetical protein